jgi:hypothetical protein
LRAARPTLRPAAAKPRAAEAVQNIALEQLSDFRRQSLRPRRSDENRIAILGGTAAKLLGIEK